MSHSSVILYVRAQDLLEVCEVFNLDIREYEDQKRAVIEIDADDCKWAWHSEREKAALSGLTFFGSHQESESDGPQEFAVHDSVHMEHDVNWSSELTVVVEQSTGKVTQSALQYLQRYVKHRRMTERVVHGVVCKHCKKPKCDLLFRPCKKAKANPPLCPLHRRNMLLDRRECPKNWRKKCQMSGA